MKDVASLINERKRKVESINKIARWQSTIESWEVSSFLLSEKGGCFIGHDRYHAIYCFANFDEGNQFQFHRFMGAEVKDCVTEPKLFSTYVRFVFPLDTKFH